MFNKYPINPVRQPFLEQPISKGYEALTELLKASLDEKTGTPTLIIVDGTHGADFQSFIRHAASAIEKQGWSLNVQSTAGYLKSGETLREEFDRNITENRAFGYVTEDEIEAYFVLDARETLATRLKEQNGRTAIIVFGPGAYWLAGERIGTVLFLDVSREYQQIQHKKQLLNFGMSWNRDSVEKYKISYFVEWPILETYRKRIFQNIDLYLDMNKPEEPVFLTISDLEGMIRSVAQNPLRVKPFSPLVFGVDNI